MDSRRLGNGQVLADEALAILGTGPGIFISCRFPGYGERAVRVDTRPP